MTFDTDSGISVEEQKEILAQINGIAEKNRKQLSKSAQPINTKPVINAKKNSLVFPLVVNIAAVLLLCIGGLFIFSFNGKIDAQVREGTAVFNLTERALIDEIRKDTADRIAEKEQEINSIFSRLEDVDSQLSLLYSSNIELTAEQRAAEERLLAMQNSYRTDLAALNDERSRILEDSRSREARLRAEFAAAEQRANIELDAAMVELEQLTREQERTAAIEAQFLGGLASVSLSIQNGQFEQAARSLENLNFFVNSSAFASSRAIQANRGLYNHIISSMETMVEIFSRTSNLEAGRENWELELRNTQLETTITEMQRTLDAFSTGSTGQARRLAELEENASTLQTTITSLETEKNTLTQTVTTLQNTNTAKDQEIANLRNQIDVIRQALLENN